MSSSLGSSAPEPVVERVTELAATAVDADDAQLLVQVIDYYSNTGVAGFPTIRYARIR